MAQQTAVDWLENKFQKFLSYYEGNHKAESYTIQELSNDFEQAKQMEREQKIGLLNWMNEVSKVEPMRLETDHDDIVDQYYNETFGK